MEQLLALWIYWLYKLSCDFQCRELAAFMFNTSDTCSWGNAAEALAVQNPDSMQSKTFTIIQNTNFILTHHINMAPCLLCDHIHLLSSDRERHVIVKMLQLSFCVFACAFRPEISSFFLARDASLFCYFCVNLTSYFPFHIVSKMLLIYIWNCSLSNLFIYYFSNLSRK